MNTAATLSPQPSVESVLVMSSALRARKIKAVIPEKSDQVANRHRKGRRSTGGRPPMFDAVA